MPDRWSTREGVLCHEINFSAEALNRTPVEICTTSLHEAVHVLNWQQGIKDVSAGGRHNKRFKASAERVGLICETPHDNYGHGYTTASPDLIKQIENDFRPDMTKLDLFRLAMPAKKTKPKPTTKWVEVTCGCTTAKILLTIDNLTHPDSLAKLFKKGGRELLTIPSPRCEEDGCGKLFKIVD